MSTKSSSVEIDEAQSNFQNCQRRMKGYAYVPMESGPPIHAINSDIRHDEIINLKRIPKMIDRYNPASVEEQSDQRASTHNRKIGLGERESPKKCLKSSRMSTLTKKRTRMPAKKKIVYTKFPNLPKFYHKPASDTEEQEISKLPSAKMQEFESVLLHGPNKSNETDNKSRCGNIETSSSTLIGHKSEESPKFGMRFFSEQEDKNIYARENRILKKQIHALLTSQAQEIANIEKDLDDVRKENEYLERKIAQTEPSSRRLSQPGRADIDEAHARNATIKRLSIKVDKACRIDKYMENHQRCNWAQGSSDSDGGMIKIKKAVICLANSLKKCLLSSQEFEALMSNDEKCHDTLAILNRAIGDVEFLFLEPWLAFRAFLFLFVRVRVFYSDVWAGFHCDGFVAREYQRAIELCAPEGFLETFHATTFADMTKDKRFKDLILRPHCEDVRDELMDILIPLMDPSKIEDIKKNIEAQANSMLEHAFDLRASCIPSPTERFEIVHYRPGDLFDSGTMQAENLNGQEINPPDNDGGKHRIKICVHGLMLAHQVKETTSGVEFLKVMGQPFLESDQDEILESRIVSGKARVILETQSE